MKRISFLLFLCFYMCMAGTGFAAKPILSPEKEQITKQQLELRIIEIKAIDKSHLSPTERRDLRKEVYRKRQELGQLTSGNVVLRVAAIVVNISVFLLLI